jgi:hypothetical protein
MSLKVTHESPNLAGWLPQGTALRGESASSNRAVKERVKEGARQIRQIADSIQTFGFTAPVLVDEAGVILSGHGRVQAAQELGLTSIPTRTMSGLSQAITQGDYGVGVTVTTLRPARMWAKASA